MVDTHLVVTVCQLNTTDIVSFDHACHATAKASLNRSRSISYEKREGRFWVLPGVPMPLSRLFFSFRHGFSDLICDNELDWGERSVGMFEIVNFFPFGLEI